MTRFRVLYDMEYLDMDCNGLPFDPLTWVDDSVGTYATNFAIALAGILTAVLLAVVRKRKEADTLLMVGIFASAAVGFFVAGVGHIVFRTNDAPYFKAVYSLSYAFNGLSGLLTLQYGLKLIDCFGSTDEGAMYKYKRGVYIVLSLAAVVPIILSVVWSSLLVVIAMNTIAAFLLIFAYLRRATTKPNTKNNRWYYVLKAAGVVTIVASGIVQLFLQSKCGSEAAYKDCFRECPFKNPAVFNHNGLFHIIYLVGMILLAWGEVQAPSLLLGEDILTTGKRQTDDTFANEGNIEEMKL